MTAIARTEVYILDTETTGVTAKDEVIELAYFACPAALRQWVTAFVERGMGLEIYTEQFKPSVPINPHAHKVHGLSMLKLLGKRPSKEITLPKDMKYMVGHNIAFDHRMLGKPENILLIDTLVIVRILRKLGMLTNDEMEGKDKLDVLVEHYFPEIAKTLVKPFHSALDDCYKVILLVSEILRLFPNVDTWEKLYELQTMGKKK